MLGGTLEVLFAVGEQFWKEVRSSVRSSLHADYPYVHMLCGWVKFMLKTGGGHREGSPHPSMALIHGPSLEPLVVQEGRSLTQHFR